MQYQPKRGRHLAGWTAFGIAAMTICACGAIGPQLKGGAAGETAVFPDPSHATMPEGDFVNLDNLRNVSVGMTKRQLYALLGKPHFNEGVFGVRQWNYLFDFYRRNSEGAVVNCQYQVQFDKHYRASAFYWKPSSCRSVLTPTPALTQTPVPASLPLAQPTQLSGDALFGFDRAELSSDGRRQLSWLLQRMHPVSDIGNISITGYADRLGDEAHNLELSRRRARAVGDFLAVGGISAAAIHTEGQGSARPLVQCAQKIRSRLIKCLAPNRRVEIAIVARF